MAPKKQYTIADASKLPRPRPAQGPKTLRIFDHDIDEKTYDRLRVKPFISIDTETDGLNFRTDKLRLVQLCTPERQVYMIRNPDHKSRRLCFLLAGDYTGKVFHNALFDLCFIKAWMGIDVHGPIECTKTLMKMIAPEHRSGLGSACKTILDIKLNKSVEHGQWGAKTLTARQKEYAAGDVIHLQKLMRELKKMAGHGTLRRYRTAMDLIVEKARLEVEGFVDIFDYPQFSAERVLEERRWWRARLILFQNEQPHGLRE